MIKTHTHIILLVLVCKFRRRKKFHTNNDKKSRVNYTLYYIQGFGELF